MASKTVSTNNRAEAAENGKSMKESTDDKHIFNKETDSEKLAMDIVRFLRKWGMWQEVQIFTGGKCYTDGDHGELVVRNEEHPEKYLKGISDYDCDGNAVRKDFSNPDRLLDMTFEGVFYGLLNDREYEVKIGDVSHEVRHIIVPEKDECQERVYELTAEYLKEKSSWDPAEFDSYEEWLELSEYSDMDLSVKDENASGGREVDFSSTEEYEDFLMRHAVEREIKIDKYFEDKICDDEHWDSEVFFNDGSIVDMIIEEFNDLLKKYGLRYDPGFSWSLTTYRI